MKFRHEIQNLLYSNDHKSLRCIDLMMKYTVVPYQEILPTSYGTEILFVIDQPARLAKSAVAKEILDIDYLKSVLIGEDLVIVTKSGIQPW